MAVCGLHDFFLRKKEAPCLKIWWFLAIMATGIVVIIGTTYFLKKRKSPKPDAPFQHQDPLDITLRVHLDFSTTFSRAYLIVDSV